MTRKIFMPHWPVPQWKELPGNPLGRTQALLDVLGNPERNLPPVIHVTGTNGKGSVIAFLRTILTAAGYRVHANISPHLSRFNERIILNGEEIKDSYLYDVLERCRVAAGDLPLDFFEGTTAASMLAFSENEADILLVESGMGWAFDPTNVIKQPFLSIMTSIYYDHMEYLGNTLEAIAHSKCAMLRENVPCIVSAQQPEVLGVIEERAAMSGTPLYIYGKHFQSHKISDGMRFTDAQGSIDLPLPGLTGDHQIVNAGTAVAVISALTDFDVSGEAIAQGLVYTRWPGRLERVRTGSLQPLLPEGWELWFDGGHNESAGHALAHHIDTAWNESPVFLIFGTTKGKDCTGFFLPFKGKVEQVAAIHVDAEPKSYTAEAIAGTAHKAGLKAIACDDIRDAVSHCVATHTTPSRILVCGSLYLKLQVA